MAWDRQLRLQEIIKEKVAMILIKEIKDPRMGFLTIMKAKLAKDKASCDISYSVLGSDADKRMAQRALDDARGVIQGILGRTLETRVIPVLRFILDESVENSVRMTQLIADARREDQAAAIARGEIPPPLDEIADEAPMSIEEIASKNRSSEEDSKPSSGDFDGPEEELD